MSFDKYNKYAQTVNDPNSFYNEIDTAIIHDSILYLDEKAQKIKAQPFEYYFENIINEFLQVDFRNIFLGDDYKNIKLDATECLDICDDFSKMSSRTVNTWLSSSFKVVDYLVLHIIQVVRNDKPKSYPNLGLERARYRQFTEYNNENLSFIGTKLLALYEKRNGNEHRTKRNEDGTQILVRPNRNKTREMVMDYYPLIMKGLKKEFSRI